MKNAKLFEYYNIQRKHMLFICLNLSLPEIKEIDENNIRSQKYMWRFNSLLQMFIKFHTYSYYFFFIIDFM